MNQVRWDYISILFFAWMLNHDQLVGVRGVFWNVFLYGFSYYQGHHCMTVKYYLFFWKKTYYCGLNFSSTRKEAEMCSKILVIYIDWIFFKRHRYLFWIRFRLVGRSGHKSGCGPNMGNFCPSCIRLVYFLRKSTEFHVKRTECQIILFHFLILIFS